MLLQNEVVFVYSFILLVGSKGLETRAFSAVNVEIQNYKLMAPNPKFAKAYKAMRALGYPQHIVKPVLKSLLDVYNQNWQHIEDQNYTVLVDAILESEECKEREQQKFHLVDEPEEDEPPLKKSRLRSQAVQALSSPGDSSPSFKGTMDKPVHHVEYVIPESNGKEKMIESVHVHLFDNETEAKVLSPVPHYRREVKTTTPNSSSGSKPKKKIQVSAHDKTNESDLLSPGTQLNENYDTYTSCSIVPRMVDETGKKELLPDDLSELEVPLSVVLPGDSSNAKVHISTSLEVIDLDMEDTNNVELLTQGDSSNAKEPFSTSLEQIDLDMEDPSAFSLCYEDESSSGKDSLPQGNCLEYECSVATKEENKSSTSSQIDIASSSSGEVKLSIIYESSLPSNFCIPSLDALFRRMEEKLHKSYRINQSGFSVMNLMKDICEGFLAVGTNTTLDEGVSSAEAHANPVAPRILDTQDVLNRNVSHQVGFCVAPNISLGPVEFQSLNEAPPKIPKFQSLNCFDLSRCKIDLTMQGTFSERNKNSLALGDQKSSTSTSMVIVQTQHFSNDMLSSAYYIDDITRGEENLEISLINEINNEHQPIFKYIPRNITYQSAYVKFLLARISDENCCSNCFGDCLSSKIPCACAGETGGEFAYMPGGIVKEKFLEDCMLMNRSPQQKNLFYCQECPLERSKDKNLSGKCKGHLVRKFIKECWYKCGCIKDCGNRVVQRGITCKLQVFMTPEGKGWGLRTLEDLPKGAFICEYVGEIVTNMELFDRNSQHTGKKHTYPVLLDADWCTEGVLKDEEALCLDATFYGNVARFVNHRCDDANLVEIPVEVETPDHHYYHLAFFTTRKVDAFEELTWDYGIDFSDHTHPVKAFKCGCGSQFCRDKKSLKSVRSRG
ncbi:probable inactive histone-lysine N-methyltransferase SUVR2 [Coffea eugenioides]|uniref:probable inactive histone-lysine N-methyltransferase SUVR2 n=1 Tax=Coffea eugenioides TaxID=49369 RepID=UPI000F60B027|nr:probable inactive histone-lysine N-methyltransferase SUVR2 [Coffea eugenioides]